MGKVLLIVIACVVVVVIVAGAWVGSSYALNRAAGTVTTDDRQLPAFTRIEVSGSGTLILANSASPSIRIEAHKNVVSRIETRVTSDGTLHIGGRRTWWPFDGLWATAPITYRVSGPGLTGVSVSGSMTVRSDAPIRGQDFAITTSGSSDIQLQLDVQALTDQNSGMTHLVLAGTTDTAAYNISGSATVLARDLVSRVVTASSSGSSRLELNVSHELNVDISGSGSVSYLGNARVSSQISGSGEVSRLQP